MRVEGSDASGRLRLAELIAALSLTTDLGMGFPLEHAARACLLATHLGRRLGLSEADVADVYFTSLLKHIGCTAFAREQASYLLGLPLPRPSHSDEGERPGQSSSST